MFNGKRIWVLIVLIPLAFGLGIMVHSGDDDAMDHGPDSTSDHVQNERWTCAMHPQIILPSNDQQCPICFMDLILLEEQGHMGLDSNELALSPEAAALADVGTSVVQRRFVARQVELVGKISVDETRLRQITARFGGRLDRLYLAATGENVIEGMKLAEIYSPEIYGAQAELRTAVQSLAVAAEGPDSNSARRLLAAAKKRLLLLGLDHAQVDGIAAGEDLDEHQTLSAPFNGVVTNRLATEGQYVKTGAVLYEIADLSSVWATLQAYERDLTWLRSGQTVEFQTRSHPGMVFSGEILFMDPVLNEKTRTVEVRVQVENAEGLLKPGMLVSASVEAVLDNTGRPIDPLQVAEPPLVVPASAPLLTGRRAVVYVRTLEENSWVFQGRTVILGPRAGDFYLVKEGLSEGEEVVTRGAFKIDSALQIQARSSMMMAPADLDLPQENHEKSPVLKIPEEFRDDLAALLESYLILQKTLADDDNSGSAVAVVAVAKALGRAQNHSSNLTVDGVMQWTALYSPMEESLRAMSRSGDLALRRVPFQPLSDNLWLVFEAFGSPGSQVVRRFNCPMAFDNAGADWIQLGTTTSNPYYGDQMLRCGSEIATLGHGDH